ncbi:MAG: hypothetical protein GPJ29_23535 [Microcystis aeruginosa BK11-02]|nr:hypothetical protein [Microcystis aeruginosa BK11-02]
MTEYLDLSFFTYTHSPWVFKSGFPYVLLNVGWIGNEIKQNSNSIDDKIFKSLCYNIREFIKYPVNLYRGSHRCEICGYDPYVPGVEYKGGNGEIWIQGPNNLVFVAPTMILHYIEDHKYVPPIEFIQSAVNVSSMESYTKFKSLYDKSAI